MGTNVLMCELNSGSLQPGKKVDSFDVSSHLDLGATTSLQQTLRQLLTITDDMSQEINKYTNHQRQIFKPTPAPSRLDTLLISNQVTNYCKQVGQFSSQSLGKLFMAEAFQENSEEN